MYTIYILSQYRHLTNFNVQKALPKRLHNSLWYKITLLKYQSKELRLEHRPRGPMDKAPDYESVDCGFESHRGQVFQGSNFQFQLPW